MNDSMDYARHMAQAYIKMARKDLPENLSGKPKRGRPRSVTLDVLSGLWPEVKSRRGLSDKKSLAFAFGAIQDLGSAEAKSYLLSDKTMKSTLITALGRLKVPEAIHVAAEQITKRRYNATEGKMFIRLLTNQKRNADSFENAIIRVCEEYRVELELMERVQCLRNGTDVLEEMHWQAKGE